MRTAQLTGMRFGRLVVLERAGSTKYGKAQWKCLCDCGNEHLSTTQLLTDGRVKSCGCLGQEQKGENGKKNRVHGCSPYGLYVSWRDMIARCENPNHKSFPNYGGRGITISPAWRNSFEAFSSWAVSEGWREGLTIERKNNDEGYYPENCKWATRKEQAQNRRPRTIRELVTA